MLVTPWHPMGKAPLLAQVAKLVFSVLFVGFFQLYICLVLLFPRSGAPYLLVFFQLYIRLGLLFPRSGAPCLLVFFQLYICLVLLFPRSGAALADFFADFAGCCCRAVTDG
jgi:hypothetical protein